VFSDDCKGPDAGLFKGLNIDAFVNSYHTTKIRKVKIMGYHRIVCTNQVPVGQPASHAHIVAVGIGATSDAYTQRLSLEQVIAAIDRGEVFYTQGEQSGKVALVQKARCPNCYHHHQIIKSAPDAVTDNNLDSLAFCRIN
jgi:hypothetical protein